MTSLLPWIVGDTALAFVESTKWKLTRCTSGFRSIRESQQNTCMSAADRSGVGQRDHTPSEDAPRTGRMLPLTPVLQICMAYITRGCHNNNALQSAKDADAILAPLKSSGILVVQGLSSIYKDEPTAVRRKDLSSVTGLRRGFLPSSTDTRLLTLSLLLRKERLMADVNFLKRCLPHS